MSTDGVFYLLFDECVDRLNTNESIQTIIDDCPEFFEELKELLEIVDMIRNQNLFAPSDAAKAAGRSCLRQIAEQMDL